MENFEEILRKDLHQFLQSMKEVDERLPECPDVEDKWEEIVKAYIPDGIREFQDYPSASLGWMMYIGMSVAKMWDTEWDIYSKIDNLYAYMRDKRGYDSMDEYIREEVLLLQGVDYTALEKVTGECASRVYNALRHQDIEPGTKEAFNAYVSCLHQLYLMGAAMQLNRMGYYMKKNVITEKSEFNCSMRQRSILALIAIVTLLNGCKSYNHILENIYDKDQSVREWTVGMASLSADEIAEYSYEMARTDSLNQTTVFDILDKEGWPSHLSDKANRAIWLVIDHSDASNRIKYLDLVKVKAEEGVLSKSDYAILKDRTLMENGLAQIYGTQIKMAATVIGEDITMQLYLWPVTDATALDSLRNTVGLSPIEEYLKTSSDAVGDVIVWDRTKTVEDF